MSRLCNLRLPSGPQSTESRLLFEAWLGGGVGRGNSAISSHDSALLCLLVLSAGVRVAKASDPRACYSLGTHVFRACRGFRNPRLVALRFCHSTCMLDLDTACIFAVAISAKSRLLRAQPLKSLGGRVLAQKPSYAQGTPFFRPASLSILIQT